MESRTSAAHVDSEFRDLLNFILKENWQFAFVDSKIVELCGYENEDFTTGRINWLDIVHEEDRGTVTRAVRKALDTDRYYAAEFRILKNGGGLRWIRMRGPVFTDEEGNFLHISGVMNDVTPRKQAQTAFETEHEIFVSVADSLEDGLYLLSDDYQITFMNRALIDLVGDHVGEGSNEALHEREDLFSWSLIAATKYESCGFQEFQEPESGRTFHVRTFPIVCRSGTKWKLGQIKETTKNKRLERKLRDFAHRVRAIAKAANMAHLGIFILEDDAGMEARFRFANNAFCRISGYSQEELLKRSINELIHPDDLDETRDRYRRRLGGEVFSDAYEVRIIRKDSVQITGLFMGARTMHAGNLATVGFVRDITVRKEFQRSLELSQRLASIGKLSAEFAHEINNPLTSILTFNKLIDKILEQKPFRMDRVAELREYVSFVSNEARRCADISRNLLNFSRSHEIRVKEHDIHEILEKSLNILRHRAEMSGIRIDTVYARDIPKISCDFQRIQQVFINLFWNAMEAMPGSGVLSVATCFEPQQQCLQVCKSGKNMVKITITDTGVGIPKQNLDRIFEPFFSTKGEKSGVGLGLSVAYGIIRKHQGMIQVHSEVGKGTCFVIQLPTDICTTCVITDA